MRKELFICDSCGARTRLNSAQRHWCGACKKGAPVEMRYGKNKKTLILEKVDDDIMQERAAVRSLQSAYQERDFVLHAPASSTR
jgi:thiol-disulfide isomerase/thioredoxin